MKPTNIKISTGIKDTVLWEDPIKLGWWLKLCIEAEHPLFAVNGFDCDCGQIIMSHFDIALLLNTSKHKARYFIEYLKKNGLIKIDFRSKIARITFTTIVSYKTTPLEIRSESWKRLSFEKLITKQGFDSKGKEKLEIDFLESGIPIESLDRKCADITLQFFYLFIGSFEMCNINNTQLYKSNFYNWYLDIKYLLENGKTTEQIRAVWRYLFDDDILANFSWRATIKSTSGLKKHFDEILKKAYIENNKPKKLTDFEAFALNVVNAKKLHEHRKALN